MSRIAMVLTSLLYPMAASAGSIHVFNLPGYATTCGTAIASNGLVAGTASGGGNGQSVNFLHLGGKFSTPSYGLPPGLIYYSGVNRWGDLVGFELSSSYILTSFEIHAGAVTLEPVLAIDAITDNGTVLEQVATQPAQGLGEYDIGMVVRPSGAPTILDDGTGHTQPAGMDGRGERVVGISYGTSGTQAWVYHARKFKLIGVPGALQTSPSGVDAQGRVAGTFYALSGTTAVTHGFLYQNGAYTVWDAPGATSTEINGENDSGRITGCFTDSFGTHGFSALP